MANRNESDAREQETLPGPGPGVSPLLRGSGSSGVRPVEQMVDAAIERIAHEQRAREQRASSHAIERARDAEREGGHELDLAPFEARSNPRAGKPTRLRWKGLDVSDEFRTYAERVARGEDLPPFEGRVLAEPNAAFPWDRDDARHEGRGSRAVLWGSAAVVIALLAWSIAARLEPTPLANDAPEASDVAAEVNGDRGSSVANTSGVDSSGSGISGSSVRGHGAGGGDVPSGGNVAVGNARSDGAVPGENAKAIGAATSRASQVGAASAAGAGSASTPVASAPNNVAPAPANAAVAHTPPPSAPAKVVPAPTHLPAPPALPRAPEPSVVKPAVAAAKASPDEDFGILPEGDPTMVAATVAPSTTPSAAKSAPVAGASVGDLARVGQPVSGAVRKEPERESSAKGSLLVETPSF